MITHLVTIDPGLASAGWAVFSVRGLKKHEVDPERLRNRMIGYGSAKTKAHDDTPSRLRALCEGIKQGVMVPLEGLRYEATLFVIEKPAMAQNYRRKGMGASMSQMGDGMAKLNMSIGALTGMAHSLGCEVEYRSPNTQSKTERWRQSVVLFDNIKGRTNKEVRDAIWLGVQVMKDGRRVWAPAVTPLGL